MATTAQTIVDRAKIILLDLTSVRWSEPELLGWLNDGQREVAILKPDSFIKNQSVALAAGTKQTIPADGVVLVDVVRNMGLTPGTTAGDIVRVTDRGLLDVQKPSWHTDAAAAAVKHFMYDPRDPTHFYIWPKSDGTNFVELVYGALPPAAAIGVAIALSDIYVNALLDYVLYRAFLKESEYADADRAGKHYAMFAQSLGIKAAQQAANNPNAS